MTSTTDWPQNACQVVIRDIAADKAAMLGTVSKFGSNDPRQVAERFAAILKPGHSVEVWDGPAVAATNGTAQS